jgi:type IV pilus assembly protein PilV
VEALAALAVFPIGILGVLHMNLLASQQNVLARRQVTASKMARDLVDAFERLPFDHRLLSTVSTLPWDHPDFRRFDEPNGRMLLSEVQPEPGVRPLLGAAQVSQSIEGRSPGLPAGIYQVAWRVAPLEFEEGNAIPEARRILVMVRFAVPGGGFKQVDVWAVKPNPQAIGQSNTGVPASIPEI